MALLTAEAWPTDRVTQGRGWGQPLPSSLHSCKAAQCHVQKWRLSTKVGGDIIKRLTGSEMRKNKGGLLCKSCPNR